MLESIKTAWALSENVEVGIDHVALRHRGRFCVNWIPSPIRGHSVDASKVDIAGVDYLRVTVPLFQFQSSTLGVLEGASNAKGTVSK